VAATIANVKEDREMRNDESADTVIEVSVMRGEGARLELPAETADRLKLSDGDTVAALIGPTATELERRAAVERWKGEGVGHSMSREEFLAWLDRCPEPAG
jgi:hypothetical protein